MLAHLALQFEGSWVEHLVLVVGAVLGGCSIVGRWSDVGGRRFWGVGLQVSLAFESGLQPLLPVPPGWE